MLFRIKAGKGILMISNGKRNFLSMGCLFLIFDVLKSKLNINWEVLFRLLQSLITQLQDEISGL